MSPSTTAGQAGARPARRLTRSGWGLAAPLLVTSLLLFAVPTAEVLRYSFSGGTGTTLDGFGTGQFTHFFDDPFYWRVLANTLSISAISTAVTAVLAFPFAYNLATRPGWQRFQLFALFSPLLINGVVRIFGLQILLEAVNRLLINIHLISAPLPLLYSYWGIIIGQALFLFPYMTVAIFASVSRIDVSLTEAARTLGAGRLRVFGTVILPLAVPGLTAGAILTFTAAAGSYFIPAMMGGNTTVTMPVLIFNSVSQTGDWPFGAAVAVILVAVILPLLAYSSRRGSTAGAAR